MDAASEPLTYQIISDRQKYITYTRFAGFARDIFLPHDRQHHVLALEPAMHRRPVRLGETPLALPATATGLREKPGFSAVSVTSSGNGQVSPAGRHHGRRDTIE